MTSEITCTCFSARINKIQALMAAAIMGQTNIPKGSGPYPAGCTDLMSKYTKQVIL